MSKVYMRWIGYIRNVLFSLSVVCFADAEERISAKVQPKEVALNNNEELSSSGLLSVLGKNQQQRSGILSIAEKMRKELFELGGKGYEKQKLPIIIQLIGSRADDQQPRSMTSKLEYSAGGLRIKLYIHLANTIDHDLLQYHLMELFLYERGLSNDQVLGEGERVLVKPWIITGLLEAIKIKRGRSDRDLYQADIDYFDVLSVEEVFASSEEGFRKMMGMQPMAFRAISGAMVSSLLRQKNGPVNMESYLSEFATFKGESASLMRKHFPGMNKSKNSLQKWVNLEMLELGTADVTQALSILETDDRLESCLRFRYRDENQVKRNLGVHDYEQILLLEDVDRTNIVRGAMGELQRLSYRCFPEYRSIIFEYFAILHEIAKGGDENIKDRLIALDNSRQRMKEAFERTTDYLDWYYITQSSHVGGDFKQYREISDALEKEAKKAPPSDHMKSYLDSVQELFTGR